jgi:hypothetical protein
MIPSPAFYNCCGSSISAARTLSTLFNSRVTAQKSTAMHENTGASKAEFGNGKTELDPAVLAGERDLSPLVAILPHD